MIKQLPFLPTDSKHAAFQRILDMLLDTAFLIGFGALLGDVLASILLVQGKTLPLIGGMLALLYWLIETLKNGCPSGRFTGR